MVAFVLIPGAGGAGSYWSAVVPLLEEGGHEAVAVDLPGPDPRAGLAEYSDLVVAAARPYSEVVLVAQSLGGFTAPLAAERLPVRELVLVNAMIPVPGERPGEWWEATGSVPAREEAAERGGYGEFAPETYFLHDVDDPALLGPPRDETDAVFGSRCEFTSWPSPIRVLAGADDRLFPAQFQARIAQERLGVDADVLPGGHLIAMAQPQAVAHYLLRGAG
ncbi:MAG TPA: alpha/beta fold hydrolase [Frankiaceae bacterium]|nr:alpha/beta fold hydrolase [Frankiaceae bacterium]